MDFLIAFIASVLRAEFYAWMPRLSEWLIKREIPRLLPDLQDRYREEWKASLADIPGSVMKIVHALNFVIARTVTKMNGEFVETKLNEFYRALEPLAAKHEHNAKKIRTLQLATRQQLARLNDLDDHVANRARDLRTMAKLPDETRTPEKIVRLETLLDLVDRVEDFEHLLVRAMTRAATLTKMGADGFDHKIAQTDHLLQSIYAKCAHLHNMLRKREISATTLALGLEDVNQELVHLTSSIEDAVADDGNTTRDKEHKNLIDAVTTAISKAKSTAGLAPG